MAERQTLWNLALRRGECAAIMTDVQKLKVVSPAPTGNPGDNGSRS
jgi:hypothetical protein